MIKRLVTLFFILTPIVALSDDTSCARVDCFASSIKVGEQDLPLRGTATYRFWGFRIYTAALYAPPTADRAQILSSDTPRALVLHYHYPVSAEQFIERSADILTDIPGLELETINDEANEMYSMFEDVKPGDRYSLTYAPALGESELLLNNVSRGRVRGAQFAAAYFAIWLSEYGISRRFFNDLIDS